LIYLFIYYNMIISITWYSGNFLIHILLYPLYLLLSHASRPIGIWPSGAREFLPPIWQRFESPLPSPNFYLKIKKKKKVTLHIIFIFYFFAYAMVSDTFRGVSTLEVEQDVLYENYQVSIVLKLSCFKFCKNLFMDCLYRCIFEF
jgi:hypothetical protein